MTCTKKPKLRALSSILLAVTLLSAHALDGKTPVILILNSYNPEYQWTENQHSGIMSMLEALETDYVVFTEYLDWKRFPDDWHIGLMHDICKEKYQSRNIDLIITTDDRALQFAIDYRKELFSDAPIVFAGVYKNDADILTAGERRITGVYEQLDIDTTLRCAKRMNPDIDTAYILNERTESGNTTESLIAESLERIMPKISVNSLSGMTIEELEGFVPTLGKNSFIIIGSYSVESGGKTFTTNVLARRISKSSSVPVYVLFDHVFGSGTIGGSMLSGNLHGRKAGTLALRVLSGEDIDSIKPVFQTEFSTSFDYAALSRFEIPLWLLPWNATVINRPQPFFVRYRTESIFLSILFLLMVLFISMLLFQVRKTRRLAYTDPLTGLNNRTQTVHSGQKLLPATGKDRKFALMILDIDNFKYTNDTFGHDTGDKALIQLSRHLARLENDETKISRIGGDEFAILMTNTTLPEIMNLTRIIGKLSDNMFIIDDNEIYLTFSTGIAIYPDNAEDFQELFRNAESAVHRAKSTGKINCVFYDDSMSSEMREWMAMAVGLRTAVEDGELFVMYQPQVNVKTGRIDGVEALVRWNHPKRGLISPAAFIPVAEACGQIDRIGTFVLRSACALIKNAEAAGSREFTVSVNVSVKQLAQKNFTENILRLVEEERVETSRLSLEVTESVMIDSMEKIKQVLSILSKAGFRISLDDFGTGYSSLTYLHRLPINYIKIDKSFIDNMLTEPRSQPLTSSIISISHELGLLVVAEGVENREQVEFLETNSCDLIQGYYFSKPKMPGEIIAMLEQPFR